MEVHHHSHTPRKKWTHYFWEFLMLFLAVFCGFLAENEREHLIEHRREKQFMKMMIEDLKHDTSELNFWHRRVFDTIARKMDSSLNILFLNKLTPADIIEYYHQLPGLVLAIDVVLEDRTSFQLKSSGNLRLIRNKPITDGLANYWTRVDKLERTLQPTYEHDRQETRKLIFSILNFSYFTNKDSFGPLLPEVTQDLKLINDDFSLRVQLGNRVANQRRQLNTLFKTHFSNLKRQATDLIMLIKQEYNL